MTDLAPLRLVQLFYPEARALTHNASPTHVRLRSSVISSTSAGKARVAAAQTAAAAAAAALLRHWLADAAGL